MDKSLIILLSLAFLGMIVGCATHQPPRRTALYTVHRGSLTFANSAGMAGAATLPGDFAADINYRPMWLNGGREIAIAGRAGGRSGIIGYSGAAFSTARILSADAGRGAPNGALLDVTTSPDGSQIATAVDEPGNRVEVIVLEASGARPPAVVAAFEGKFSSIQLGWPTAGTIVLAVRDAALSDDHASGSAAYLIDLTGAVTALNRDPIQCALSHLSFGPKGQLAVAQGDRDASPAMIDLHDGSCRQLAASGPIKVLDWAPDATAFLYAGQGPMDVPGIFRYEVASGEVAVIAVSSGAAAYASDGATIAVGNDWLSWERVAQAPAKPVAAQVALAEPGRQEVAINGLSFVATAAMLAQSSLSFSRQSNDGVIDVTGLSAQGPVRALIEYVYPRRAAFPLAISAPGAPLAMSWSPDGRKLAIVDAAVRPNLLTVIAPSR